jgi:hypothetical protein
MCLHFINKQINKGKTPSKGTKEKRKDLSLKKNHPKVQNVQWGALKGENMKPRS